MPPPNEKSAPKKTVATERRVIMARNIARRWIAATAKAEYRLRVLYGAKEYKNLPNLLRAFRNGKVAMVGIKPIPDLGVTESFDGMEVWSSDKEALATLNTWFESKGFETSGVW